MIINNLIFPYDHILIVIVAIMIILCFVKGFIQSSLGLLTWVGSVLITIYSYDVLASLLSKQILKISIFNNYDYLTYIIGIILSIPIIFFISLFILKRIRKFISADLDKNILGVTLDKIFGIFFGIIFTYSIITLILILFNRFELNETLIFIKENSYLLYYIDEINIKYINFLIIEKTIN